MHFPALIAAALVLSPTLVGRSTGPLPVTRQFDVRCVPDPYDMARGYCNWARCPHGQWVRGSGELLSNGQLIIKKGMETDDVVNGICGLVSYKVKDTGGNTLVYGKTGEECIPAKMPGAARIVDFAPVDTLLPASVPQNATSIELDPQCTQDYFSPLGITLTPEQAKALLTVVLTSAGSGD